MIRLLPAPAPTRAGQMSTDETRAGPGRVTG
jgi:hypothetical protein